MSTTARRVRRHRASDPGGYITGLDGLRAIAVGAVIAYHLHPGLIPGGYLGVDVFFVLSGFLITTLLLREMRKTGRINLKGFWLRRARRLLPALTLLTITVVPVAALINRDLLVGIGRQVLGALTFSSNWLEIAHGTSYFDQTSPLLFKNFWSLAVEEQFYLLWPLGFLLVMVLARSWKSRIATAVVLAGISAVLMAVLADPAHLTRVYYGTDTHLFGLAIGVALAFSWAPAHGSWLAHPTVERIRPFLGPAGLIVLAALMGTMPDQSMIAYRGGILLASIATAAILVGIIAPDSRLAQIGENGVLRWIGTRSYGLYLWHWPMLIMAQTAFPQARGTAGFWAVNIAAIILTGLICEASFRYVETPIRQLGFIESANISAERVRSRSTWAVAAAVATGVCVIGTGAAIAIAPDKSSVQQAIEAAEAAEEEDAGGPAKVPGPPEGEPEPSESAEPTAEPTEADGNETEAPGGAFDATMPTGEELTAIGDSIIVTSRDGLSYAFPGINYVAKSNRQWAQAPDLVRAGVASGEIRRAVVLDYGTNAGVPDPDTVRETIDLLGPERMIVLVNLYGTSTFIDDANEKLAQIADEYPNVRLADWHAAVMENPSILQADQTHPDLDGMHVFADVVRETFAKFEYAATADSEQ
ncbi:MAG: acyltransferase family protein [Flaviflexus sp.]|nr:acyltransferase family protein [Flaviflexus sp.]